MNYCYIFGYFPVKSILSAFFYYLSLPFIYLLALLPFPLMYGFSDFINLLLYHVLRYRREVVRQNLQSSFPEKNLTEIIAIEKKFYHHFCDLFLETFKTLTISKENMVKHCELTREAQTLFDQLADERQNFIVVMGHLGNWEWGGNSFSICCRQELFVIYHPLSNKYFDGLIYKMRTRFGTRLIAMKDTLRVVLKNRDRLTATAFIADQTPLPDKAHWLSFMNQDTAVFPGVEKIVSKLQYPMVYVSIRKVARGYYKIFAEKMDLPFDFQKTGVITEMHTRKLEADIRREPENWLWTHRRWKHVRPAVIG
jgi:KDO2-lipid IV(A) lauroyltransferase